MSVSLNLGLLRELSVFRVGEQSIFTFLLLREGTSISLCVERWIYASRTSIIKEINVFAVREGLLIMSKIAVLLRVHGIRSLFFDF